MQAPLELSAGASSVLDLRDPHLHDHAASIETPSAQVRGELRIRYRRYAQLALTYERALTGSYHALDPSQPAVQRGTASSFGLALRYSMPLDGAPNVTIGIGIEPRLWGLPYIENSPDGSFLASGGALLPMLAYSLTPAYRRGPWTFYAGLYAMQHPTVEREGIDPSSNWNGEVQRGDYNFIAYAGAELTAGSISPLLHIQRDMSASPISYGPSFGFAIAARLPRGFAIAPSHPTN